MTEIFPPAPAGGAAPVVSMRGQWGQSITRPIRAFQLSYVPVVVLYFAYGALGLIDVTRDLWIKESLSFTPSQLAGIGVWLTLPWTVKMVFGELVDTVPMFGSQRKSYILIGALLSYYNEGTGLVDTASLSAIMAEWTSNASFAARTAALFNNGLAGSGVLNGTTITADGGTGDTLNTGAGGQDWFFVFAADSVFGTPGKTTDLP